MVEVGMPEIIGLVLALIIFVVLTFVFGGPLYKFIMGQTDDSICRISVLDVKVNSRSSFICPYELTYISRLEDLPQFTGSFDERLESYLAHSIASCAVRYQNVGRNALRANSCAICEIITVNHSFGTLDIPSRIQNMRHITLTNEMKEYLGGMSSNFQIPARRTGRGSSDFLPRFVIYFERETTRFTRRNTFSVSLSEMGSSFSCGDITNAPRI